MKHFLILFIFGYVFLGQGCCGFSKKERHNIYLTEANSLNDTIIVKQSNGVPYKLLYIRKGFANDTILYNNIKVPGGFFSDFIFSDYYGHPSLKLQFAPYKATEVDIVVSFVFY